MRGPSRSRRGSALLIVLGFLSFMVVSAVAFSIYMRSERVPSSVLRRGEASRHLVKAGLAAAMAEVDQAICSDVFPGAVTANSRRDSNNRYYNLWLGRVFMPPEPCGDGEEPSDKTDSDRIVPEERLSETVPVLTLEALGYLPPALVNDVRSLARSTWSAKWRYFNFNAGRSAYVAVNVSDFFDLNRVSATNVRTSASSVSLSYLFGSRDDKGELTSTDGTTGNPNATMFQTQLDTAKGSAGDYPFVSMLDYNLALGSASPFVNWIGTQDSAFFSGGAQNYAYAKFITESMSSNSEARVQLTRLRDEDNDHKRGQPFNESLSMEGNAARNGINAQTVILASQNVEEFRDRLSPLDSMNLYDYLDRDDVPISLSLPCCERVPMVVGVKPDLSGVRIKVDKTKDKQRRKEGNTRGHEETEFAFANDFFTAAGVDALFAFPFKRGQALNGSGYRAQAVIRLFLSTARSDESGALRPGNVDGGAFAERWKTQHDMQAGAEVDDHSITLYSAPQQISFANGIVEEDEAIVQRRFTFSNPPADLQNFPLLVEDVLYNIVIDPETKAETWTATGETKYRVGFHPLDKSLKPLYTGEMSAPPGGEHWLSCAVWVRIVDADGNTVDCAPATLADDRIFNNVDNDAGAGSALLAVQGGNPGGTPMLLFSEGENRNSARTVVYSTDSSVGLPRYTSGENVSVVFPRQLYVVDPRYNYAPENWFAADSFDKNNWLEQVHQFQDGHGERDPDIFMFVSNQGYLQSMAEFAFLPRVSALADKAYWNLGNYDGTLRGRDDVADRDYCWKTYHAYNTGGVSDRLFGKNISDGDDGFKVCPYTDSDEIFLAALANTPYDWWAAGTNYANQSDNGQNSRDAQTKRQMLRDLGESYKYAFNESKGPESRITFDKLIEISAAIRNGFRNHLSGDMLNAWCSLPWDNDDPNKFLGVDISGCDPIHSVDRKYLFGFWKTCFANKQQLFLIFVRAEPTSAGGDSGGATAQLGGRAVALVWRDPMPADNQPELNGTSLKEDRRPHKMRILFYHQFD